MRRTAVGVGWMFVGRTPHYFIGLGKALCRADVTQGSRGYEPDEHGKGCCSKCWLLSQQLNCDRLHAMKTTRDLPDEDGEEDDTVSTQP